MISWKISFLYRESTGVEMIDKDTNCGRPRPMFIICFQDTFKNFSPGECYYCNKNWWSSWINGFLRKTGRSRWNWKYAPLGLNGVEREFSLESESHNTRTETIKRFPKWKALRVKLIAAYSISQDEGSAVRCSCSGFRPSSGVLAREEFWIHWQDPCLRESRVAPE